jgi:hypothetical protein
MANGNDAPALHAPVLKPAPFSTDARGVLVFSKISSNGRVKTHGAGLFLSPDGTLTAEELVDYTTRPATGAFTPEEKNALMKLEAAALQAPRTALAPQPQPALTGVRTEYRILTGAQSGSPVVLEFTDRPEVAPAVRALAEFYQGVWKRLFERP